MSRGKQLQVIDNLTIFVTNLVAWNHTDGSGRDFTSFYAVRWRNTVVVIVC